MYACVCSTKKCTWAPLTDISEVQAAAEDGSMDMCTDGKNGNAPAGTPCVKGEACEDVAGAMGLYGWCHTEVAGAQEVAHWGGCMPCDKLEAIKVYLLLDGVPVPRQRRGKDVEEDAFGRTFVSVLEPRVYLLIAEYAPISCLPTIAPSLPVAFAPCPMHSWLPLRPVFVARDCLTCSLLFTRVCRLGVMCAHAL